MTARSLSSLSRARARSGRLCGCSRALKQFGAWLRLDPTIGKPGNFDFLRFNDLLRRSVPVTVMGQGAPNACNGNLLGHESLPPHLYPITIRPQVVK